MARLVSFIYSFTTTTIYRAHLYPALSRSGWTHMIYEDIVDHNLVLRSQKMEYLDFKHLMHGNKDAGPLSIALTLNKDSPVSIVLYSC